jgi:hypothetical protein
VTLVDTVLDSGSSVNEDRYTVLDSAAWVLDGTSGFSDRSITSHPESDGVWFVETVDAFLREHVHDDESLEEIIAGAIEHTAHALVKEIDIDPTISLSPPGVEDAAKIEEMPAATIALVRWDDEKDTLEYYSLGDSAVLVQTTTGVVDYHDQVGPELFDKVLRGKVAEYLETNPDATVEELRAELRTHIRDNRRYREVPGGFWCLGLNPVSASQGLNGEYDLSGVATVTLFTDGFTQAMGVFDLYEDWHSVVEAIERDGVDEVLAGLREAQQTYDIGERPRLKPMDDVAIVYLDYEEF